MMNSQAEPQLPSFDLHEHDGEMVLHCDLTGYDESMEIALDGDALIVRAAAKRAGETAVCYRRLALPFAPETWHSVSRSDQDGLEIHSPIPEETSL